MARKLVTEINARYGKEGEYGYERYDIGVHLPNVIGFKKESRRYVAKVANPEGDLDTRYNKGTGSQTYTFLNKFNEELFKIYIEDIKVVQTNLADADKAILLSGTYDTKEGKKYQYIDKNIATKSGSVYANGELFIGATQNPLTIDENGNPVLSDTSADYIFRKPTKDNIYGAIIAHKMSVKDDVSIDGTTLIKTDLEVRHSVSLGSSKEAEDKLTVYSQSKFENTANILDKYLFNANSVEFKTATILDSTLTVKGNTTINGNLSAVYDSTSKKYMIITDANKTYTSNFIQNNLAGNLSVDGDTVLGKANTETTLTVNSNASFKGTTDITGDTTLNGQLTVVKAAILKGTLSVSGAANLLDKLTVAGATTINNTIEIAQKATLNKGMDITSGGANITGETNITGNTAIAGNLSTTGTLGVTGATTLGSSLTVNNGAKTTLTGELSVALATVLNDTLTVTKKTILHDALQVDKDINTDGVLTVAKHASVDGSTTLGKAGANTTLTINSTTNLNSTLDVTDNTTIGGTLGVTGATTLNDILTVVKAATFNDSVIIDKDLTVTGKASLANIAVKGGEFESITVSGTGNIKGATTLGSTLDVTGATTISNTLDVTDNTTIGGTLGVDGAVTLKSTLGVSGNTTIGGTLGVTGATTIDGNTTLGKAGAITTLTVNSTANFKSTLSVDDAVTLKSTLGVSGNTTIGGTLGVTGATTLSDTTISGNTKINSTLNVTKKATFNNDIQVDQNASITGTLGVAGAATLSKTLAVTGATTLNDTLSVAKAATLSSTLNVTDKATFNNDIQVDKNAKISGTLGVTGDITGNGSLTLDGTTSMYKSGDKYLFRTDSNGLHSDFTTNTFGGNVVPSANNKYSLGSSTAKWANIYATNFTGSFTGNASSATKLETARSITIKGVQVADTTVKDINNSVSKSFDGTGNIEFDLSKLGLDASKIVTGTIDLDRLPAGALDRLITVDNKAARLALTKNDVQYGDTVQEADTMLMYYVVDESKLGTSSAESAFKEYRAGHATAVAWAGVENKPDWVVDPQTLTINRVGKSAVSYNTKGSQSIDIRQISIKLNGGKHANEATTTYDTSTDKSINITPASIGAAPEAGSPDIATIGSTVRLGSGGGNASIYQDGDTYRQKINILDNDTSGDDVFQFQQSTNSGSSFNTLMSIRDDGTVVATKFVGAVEGASTKLGTADVGANDKFMYLVKGVATASTLTRGSGVKPIYFNNGTVTESTSTVGSGVKPIFMNSGTLTASSSTVANGAKLMYLNSGELTASTSSVGDSDTPVYLNSGTITSTGKKFSDYFKRSGSIISNPNTASFSVSNAIDGYMLFNNTGDTSGVASGVGGINGGTDGWTIRGYQTANNKGALEIAVGDDGDEGIYVRQYTSAGYKLPFMNKAGADSGLSYREITLMEPSTGNAIFPANVKATSFTGSLSGNATTATTASYLSTPNDSGYTTSASGNFVHKRDTSTDYFAITKHDGESVAAKIYWESGNTEINGTLTTAGLGTFNSGLKVSGRVNGRDDDEGIVISKASNNYAGLVLGDPSGIRSVFYLTADNNPVWRYATGNSNTTTDIQHPKRSGTIALNDNTSANALINSLSEGTSDLTDEDYVVTQYVGGGTTTTTYHRRAAKHIYNYIKGKTDDLYLPLAGGTMSGDITFKAIGDTATSSGLHWTGSTDGADIYYRTDAKDTGRLVLNITDDSNARIDFALNGTTKSYIDANGNFSANAATATLAADSNHVYSVDANSTKTSMTFNWVGKDGQPSWLWGSQDGAAMYVYNPSNFSVNNSKLWNNYTNDIGTLNSTDTWLLVANNDKIQHRLATDFATSGHNHDNTYLKLSGGTMTGDLVIQHATTANVAYGATNPQIIFKNNDGNQNLALIYSDYDSVQAPSSLTLIGNQGGEYFAAPNIKATKNITAGGTVTVGNGATLEYDSTNKCLNFVFA